MADRVTKRSLPRLRVWATAIACLGAIAVGANTVDWRAQANSVKPMKALAGSQPLPGLWQAYKLQFLRNTGAIVDTANGGISHSEGQGYGMLLAVAARDEPAFARIWAFARQHLQVRDDALFSWKFDASKTPAVADTNNASDGDLLIAWALLEAHAADFSGELRREAMAILADLQKLKRVHSVHGAYLLPGAAGFENRKQDGADVVNLSYGVFPAFTRIAELTGDTSWLDFNTGTRNMLAAASRNAAGLPSDWSRLPANGVTMAAASGWDATFSYNAIRVPLYAAWNGDVAPSGWTAIATKPAIVNVETGATEEVLRDMGYSAIGAVSACAESGMLFPEQLRTAIDRHYYPASLQLLSAIVIRQRYPQCW
ncbi:MAG: glycosyl hydrolase family 8 [Pseudomonadota bacterium]